jgi:hypothetical protein
VDLIGRSERMVGRSSVRTRHRPGSGMKDIRSLSQHLKICAVCQSFTVAKRRRKDESLDIISLPVHLMSLVSGFAASLSSGGLERCSLLISLAPTEGSSGVTLIIVAMVPAVHLK